MPVAVGHRSPRSSAFPWLCQRPRRCPRRDGRRGRPQFRIDTLQRPPPPAPSVVHLLAGERKGVSSRLPQSPGAPNTGNRSAENNLPAPRRPPPESSWPWSRREGDALVSWAEAEPHGAQTPLTPGLALGCLCPASLISQADGLAALLMFPFLLPSAGDGASSWARQAGTSAHGQDAASRTLACRGLPQLGPTENLERSPLGALQGLRSLLFLTGSGSESGSIWRRPACNCPLSTHWDGTRCSSHTIRQMSDCTDGWHKAVRVPGASGTGGQAGGTCRGCQALPTPEGSHGDLEAHRCPGEWAPSSVKGKSPPNQCLPPKEVTALQTCESPGGPTHRSEPRWPQWQEPPASFLSND